MVGHGLEIADGAGTGVLGVVLDRPLGSCVNPQEVRTGTGLRGIVGPLLYGVTCGLKGPLLTDLHWKAVSRVVLQEGRCGMA